MAIGMPSPIAVALKHRVSPTSPVHVEMRGETERAAGATTTCSLRLVCSLTSSYEIHQIGAPGPEAAEEEEEGPTVYESSLDDVDLHSHDACRAAVRKLLSAIQIQIPGPVSLLDPAAGEWHEPVVRDIVRRLQQLMVTTGGKEEDMRGYAGLDVSLSLHESFTYVQPEALLLACEHVAAAILPAAAGSHLLRTPDERCAVCMERLPAPLPPHDARPADDKNAAFTLPSCRHTFHRGCVAAWFEKGSTCPLCRCDMMDCLSHVHKQFGIS